MTTVFLPSFFLSLAAMANPATASGPDRFGISCSGSETVTIGTQTARQLPYDITLSIDLPDHIYCYGTCDHDQVYPIANAAAAPIRLADAESPAQSRHIMYDPATRHLSDDQRISTSPLMTVVRHAAANCTPAPFHQPWREGSGPNH